MIASLGRELPPSAARPPRKKFLARHTIEVVCFSAYVLAALVSLAVMPSHTAAQQPPPQARPAVAPRYRTVTITVPDFATPLSVQCTTAEEVADEILVYAADFPTFVTALHCIVIDDSGMIYRSNSDNTNIDGAPY